MKVNKFLQSSTTRVGLTAKNPNKQHCGMSSPPPFANPRILPLPKFGRVYFQIGLILLGMLALAACGVAIRNVSATQTAQAEVVEIAVASTVAARIPSKSAIILYPGDFVVLNFSSKAETHLVNLRVRKSGQYSIKLENTHQPYTEHWLIWDFIALKANDSVIWRIGAPDGDFSEFCNFQQGRPDCQKIYTVGSTDVKDLTHTLNDGIFPEVVINFNLNEEFLNSDLLTLVLSISDSSYPEKEPNFEMKVSFWENKM